MEYLVTDADHQGNQSISSPELRALTGIEEDKVYWVDVKAVPARVQFRSASNKAWPRIYGSESGTICGPLESEYAQLDEAGRYNVKFKFDESDLKDGKASTWVRMLQPHGGDIEGWHFPLRKGTEVIFTFLGGDPDRPVIAGVVPNLHTPSPVTRANHTTNVIQTGGRNRFELEDRAGHERITLKTPYANTMLRMGAPNDTHNFIFRTDGSGLIHTGGNLDVNVGGVTTNVFIGAKFGLTVGATADVFVGAKFSVNIGPSCSIKGLKLNTTDIDLDQLGTKIAESRLKVETNKLSVTNDEVRHHSADLHVIS
jgi:type VI secretion system secreted protein VgrG